MLKFFNLKMLQNGSMLTVSDACLAAIGLTFIIPVGSNPVRDCWSRHGAECGESACSVRETGLSKVQVRRTERHLLHEGYNVRPAVAGLSRSMARVPRSRARWLFRAACFGPPVQRVSAPPAGRQSDRRSSPDLAIPLFHCSYPVGPDQLVQRGHSGSRTSCRRQVAGRTKVDQGVLGGVGRPAGPAVRSPPGAGRGASCVVITDGV